MTSKTFLPDKNGLCFNAFFHSAARSQSGSTLVSAARIRNFSSFNAQYRSSSQTAIRLIGVSCVSYFLIVGATAVNAEGSSAKENKNESPASMEPASTTPDAEKSPAHDGERREPLEASAAKSSNIVSHAQATTELLSFTPDLYGGISIHESSLPSSPTEFQAR